MVRDGEDQVTCPIAGQPMSNRRARPGLTAWAIIGLVAGLAVPAGAQPTLDDTSELDLILRGGRVMDPESGLDGVRDIGVRGGRIVEISGQSMDGRRTVDVTGLVVAPGFIDLHAHGQDLPSSALQAQDGVTTALELEGGVFPVDDWYAARQGESRINYGATVGHGAVRRTLLRDEVEQGDAWVYRQASPEELETIESMARRGLQEGGLGIGLGIQYTPGATRAEILQLFRTAADAGVTNFVHVRFMGRLEPGSSVEAVQEMIANAAVSGASVHIVHIGSSGLEQVPLLLEMIRTGRDHGVDVSTEVYPYTAASTSLESAIFDPGWRERLGADYEDVEWVATGERLTEATFTTYRDQGGMIIIHMIPEEVVETALTDPLVMVASDGVTFLEGRAHPRGAGTFARVLGHYVREQQTLSLMDALRKMTLMPAQRLEAAVPQMRRKGRIAVGADADITIFDPALIIDRSTFENPAQASEGIVHVLVGGEFVVQDSRLLEAARPGRAVRRPVVSVP